MKYRVNDFVAFMRSCALLLLMVLPSSAQDNRATFFSVAKSREFQIQPKKGSNLHVILALDTNADTNGDWGMGADGRNMIHLLQLMFPDQLSGTHRLQTVKLIAGNKMKRKDIINVIDSLETQPSDTVMFYYSGHGGWEKQAYQTVVNVVANKQGVAYDFDSGHFLALKSGNVPRDDIKLALSKKPSQLRILITDCCANFPSEEASVKYFSDRSAPGFFQPSTVPRDERPARFSVDKHISEKTVDALFFSSIGWLSSNAAPPGKVTLGGREGGIFTNSLINKLLGDAVTFTTNNADSPHVDWRGLFENPPVSRTKAPQSYLFASPRSLHEITKVDAMFVDSLPSSTIFRVKKPFTLIAQNSVGIQQGERLIADKNGIWNDIDKTKPYSTVSRILIGNDLDQQQEMRVGDTFRVGYRSKIIKSLNHKDVFAAIQLIGCCGTKPRRDPTSGNLVFGTADISCHIPMMKDFKDSTERPTIEDLRTALGGWFEIISD